MAAAAVLAALAAAPAAGSAAAGTEAGERASARVAAASSLPARITVRGAVRRAGSPTVVAGRVPLADRDRVRIGFRPHGSGRWWSVATTASGRAGLFRARLPARRSGRVVAIPRIGEPSRSAGVRVVSRTGLDIGSRHVDVGEPVRLTGLARPGGRRGFRLAIKGPDGRVIDRLTDRRGVADATWRPGQAGRYVVTAYSGANPYAAGSEGPSATVTVYRPAHASWYGPGFYGGRAACGRTLTQSTIGVAHQSLPCGTEVRLRHGGRVVDAPVIDRGPFIPGREFDLTRATRDRLGFGDVGTIHVSH